LTRHELRAAFDRVVFESVRPGAIGLAFLYVFFAGAHLVLLKEPARTVMATLALLSAVALLVIWSLLRQRTVQQYSDRVIYTSGYSTDFADVETSLGPRVHFLPKPYQFPVLASLIRECLDAQP